MAKIIDPDNIGFYVNSGTEGASTDEFYIQTGALTIAANIATSVNLDDDAPGKGSGCTGRALYSALKIAWLASTTLRKYKFPIKMIFEGSFIVTNGWSFADQQTKDVMRDAGFQEALSADEWACMISLGSVDAPSTDQVYYTQASGFTATTTNYDKTGELNENIDVTSAKTYAKSYLREQGKLYSEYNLLVEQGLSTLNFQAYSFPLSNGTDLKTDNTINSSLYSDANVNAAAEPYQSMTLTYLQGELFETLNGTTGGASNDGAYAIGDVGQDAAGRWGFCTTAGTVDAAGETAFGTNGGTAVFETYEGEYQIGTDYYAFNRKVDCGAGTYREVYAWMQYQLRQTGDINNDVVSNAAQGTFGTMNGEVAELLAEFVGDNLKPKPGVMLFNFDSSSKNNIQHSPITVDTVVDGNKGIDPITFIALASSEVPFPFVAAGSLTFSKSLADEAPDSETVFDVYFEYITRTSGSYTIAQDTGADYNLTWASTDLDHIEAADYIVLSGFSTVPEYNGEYLVNSVGANTMNITNLAGTADVTGETATVQVDENPFGSLGATLVKNNAGTDMTGIIGTADPNFPGVVQGDGSIKSSWDFDYTNNEQKGRTKDSDATIHVIALALDTSEWAETTHTISASVGQSVTVNGNDERNYSNPA